MTDFSKIKTIDELDYQTERIERRANIQRERLEGHADFVVRQYNYAIATIDAALTPIRNTINQYRTTISVIGRVVKAIVGRKKS